MSAGDSSAAASVRTARSPDLGSPVTGALQRAGQALWHRRDVGHPSKKADFDVHPSMMRPTWPDFRRW